MQPQFKLDLVFIQQVCHISISTIHTNVTLLCCLLCLRLRYGAVCGVKPWTDPLVAELFVAFGADQVTS